MLWVVAILLTATLSLTLCFISEANTVAMDTYIYYSYTSCRHYFIP